MLARIQYKQILLYIQLLQNNGTILSENITKHIEEIEEQAEITSTVIQQRYALGISQRELANRCGIPQSSVARMESMKTTPNLDTLLKIMRQLGLKLVISK